MLTLADTIIQGVLLGGLYALYATGLSLIFGVMRLVNLAHGDLIVLAAFLSWRCPCAGAPLPVAALLVLPLMFAVGYVLQRAHPQPGDRRRHTAAAADDLRPVDHHPERPAGSVLGRLAGGSRPATSRQRRCRSAAASPSASMPLLTLRAAVLVIVALNQLFYRTALGRAFRAVSDEPRSRN